MDYSYRTCGLHLLSRSGPDLFPASRPLDLFTGNEAAWMSVRADGSEAFVAYFRVLAIGLAPVRRLRLRGLDARRRYRVDGGAVLGGDVLMNFGLPVPEASGDFRSMVWHLTATAASI